MRLINYIAIREVHTTYVSTSLPQIYCIILTFISYVCLEGVCTHSTRQWCPGTLILLCFGTITAGIILDLHWDDNRPGCPLCVTTLRTVSKELREFCP